MTMKRILSALLLAALPVSAVAATTWFVDARNGSNGYSGFSSSAPTRTIQAGDASKQGDGQPWTPTFTVKGGVSGFYQIKVGK